MMQLIIKRVSVFWIRNFDFRYLNSQKEYPSARFQDFKMNFYIFYNEMQFFHI